MPGYISPGSFSTVISRSKTKETGMNSEKVITKFSTITPEPSLFNILAM